MEVRRTTAEQRACSSRALSFDSFCRPCPSLQLTLASVKWEKWIFDRGSL